MNIIFPIIEAYLIFIISFIKENKCQEGNKIRNIKIAIYVSLVALMLLTIINNHKQLRDL